MLGFMSIAAVLSMFIANVPTVVMIVPIVQAVFDELETVIIICGIYCLQIIKLKKNHSLSE